MLYFEKLRTATDNGCPGWNVADHDSRFCRRCQASRSFRDWVEDNLNLCLVVSINSILSREWLKNTTRQTLSFAFYLLLRSLAEKQRATHRNSQFQLWLLFFRRCSLFARLISSRTRNKKHTRIAAVKTMWRADVAETFAFGWTSRFEESVVGFSSCLSFALFINVLHEVAEALFFLSRLHMFTIVDESLF